MMEQIEFMLSAVSFKLELMPGSMKRSWMTVEGYLWSISAIIDFLCLARSLSKFCEKGDKASARKKNSNLVTVSSLCLAVK